MTDVYTGGCQCGAVRFRVEGAVKTTICHCRMCQKAFGGYFAPLVTVDEAGLAWTRGERSIFQSSNHVRRGFCSNCGTPLTYESPHGLSIAAGAFDDPAALPPVFQYGTESEMPWIATLVDLPSSRTEEDAEDASFVATLVNFQHPDHDTADWPPDDFRSGDDAGNKHP